MLREIGDELLKHALDGFLDDLVGVESECELILRPGQASCAQQEAATESAQGEELPKSVPRRRGRATLRLRLHLDLLGEVVRKERSLLVELIAV